MLLIAIADPLILFFLPFLGSLLLVPIVVQIPHHNRAARIVVLSSIVASATIHVALISPIREFDLLRSGYHREHDTVAARMIDTLKGFFSGEYRMEYVGWSPYRKLNCVKKEGLYVVMYDNLGTTALITDHPDSSRQTRSNPVYAYPEDLSNALIIGAGAGPQLRQFAGRADSLTAVELDPEVVSFALSRREEALYLTAPGVNYVAWEGVSFLRSHPGPYSLILYPFADSFIASSLQSLVKAENYLYTVEGLGVAVGSLTQQGVLIVVLAESMNEYGRRATIGGFPTVAVHTYRNLLELGLAPRDIMVLTTSLEAGRGIYALYQRGGVDRNRLLNLFAEASEVTVLTDSPEFLRKASSAETTTNDRPFFYIAGRVPPGPVREAAAVLLATSFAAIVWVAHRAHRRGALAGLSPVFARKQIAYAACTGFGFMTIITVLTQRIVPVFGAPYLAGTVVISAILIGAGLTSFLMSLRRTPLPASMARTALVVAVLMILCLPALTEWMSRQLASMSLARRVLFAASSFLPIGLVLGIPFPYLLDRARTMGPSHVVLAYATDVSFSILGIVVSLIVPIVTGYAAMFYCAAAAYAGILLVLFTFRDEPVLTASG